MENVRGKLGRTTYEGGKQYNIRSRIKRSNFVCMEEFRSILYKEIIQKSAKSYDQS